MDSRKNHTVPQGYLRGFSENGMTFFQYLILQKIIRPTAIKDTCQERDFYDLTDKLSERYNQPKDILETQAFRIYETNVQRINRIFVERKLFLMRRDFEILVDGFVSQKHRTTYFRRQLNDKSITEPLLNNTVKGFIKDYESIPVVKNILTEDFLADFKASWFDNPNQHIETHLFGMLESYMGKNEATTNATKKLLNYQIGIIEAPVGEFFITSDNPGFFVDRGEDGHHYDKNLNFGSFVSVIFPMNSKQAIVFAVERQLAMLESIKPLHYTPCPIDINRINLSTFRFADQKVFCESKDYLEQFVKSKIE